MPGRQSLIAKDIQVPADLSSAAFLIVAATISTNCELKITNVGVNPTRSGVIQILREMGADIQLENARLLGDEPVADLRVRSSQLRGIEVDPDLVSLAIDEFPVLFIAAAAAGGITRFSGIGELRVKESDRIDAMAKGLRNLGIPIDEDQDTAVVHGGNFCAGTIESHGDHRIAMSFAVAATIASGAIHIKDIDAVDTSFPGFSACMNGIGVNIMQSTAMTL